MTTPYVKLCARFYYRTDAIQYLQVQHQSDLYINLQKKTHKNEKFYKSINLLSSVPELSENQQKF